MACPQGDHQALILTCIRVLPEMKVCLLTASNVSLQKSEPSCHSLAPVPLCGVRKLPSKPWPLQATCAITSTTIFRGEHISPHLLSLRLGHFLIIFITIADASFIIKPQRIISQSKKGRRAEAGDAMKCIRGTCYKYTSIMWPRWWTVMVCSSMFHLIMFIWIHLRQVNTDLIK